MAECRSTRPVIKMLHKNTVRIQLIEDDKSEKWPGLSQVKPGTLG